VISMELGISAGALTAIFVAFYIIQKRKKDKK
jgi:hypothetical protein